MTKPIVAALMALTVAAPAAYAEEREKLAEDPTKIVTKLGLRLTDTATVSGSIAFGPVSKINASYSETGEWSLGASYLFPFGIVNFAASQRDLNSGVQQTSYSLGGFAPLAQFGIQPGNWQMFAAFGANYTEGTVELEHGIVTSLEEISVSSKGGYAGVMALLPLSDRWTLRGVAVVSAGSKDYRGYSLGGGVSFAATKRDTFSIFANYSDSNLGQRDVVGISYLREF
ncbi:hypothetical protein [Shimia biformata]|uniref:hypothetical protein n=1 Tax=Shimia biformata TaxID=1294299 RepID=UPI0019516AAA|nr:hypothetical protein [Shimia biformata]